MRYHAPAFVYLIKNEFGTDVQHADTKYFKFADEMNEAKHAQHSEVYPVLEVCTAGILSLR